jgi:hypothetical protein
MCTGLPFFYYYYLFVSIAFHLLITVCAAHTDILTIYLFVLPGIMFNLQLSCVIVDYTSFFVAELGWLVRVLLILVEHEP